MLLLRQIRTLIWKNILIALIRHPVSTPLRAFLLPVVFAWFLSYARNLFIPPSIYGIGEAHPIRSIGDAFSAAGGGRNILALVNNGFNGGDISNVINQIASEARAEGKDVRILDRQDDLLSTCRNSLRGASPCIAGVVFYSSPTEGPGGIWNYTLRADGALGSKIDVTSTQNDQEIYVLPLQHAIDFAIASSNSTIDQTTLRSQEVYEYPYTSETQQERADTIRVRYMSGIIQILGVAFFIGICGVTYQLTGMMASERERWVIIAVILGLGVFQRTSLGVLIVLHVLTGLSLSSFSIFIAAFFKRSQLSGIIAVIASLLLAVVAQVTATASTGAVAVLSLLFPSMNYTFFIILMARWESQNTATDLIKQAPENPWTTPGIVLWIFLIIQIFAFPILGAIIERLLWGTSSNGQRSLSEGTSEAAVRLTGFTKQYRPTWFARNIVSRLTRKRKETVVAVKDLSMTVLRGQIMVLLGANGSGKSTTLDAIAGLTTITNGTIEVDGTRGIGLCPQKNVLFNDLTVEENVMVFNRLKSIDAPASKEEIKDLIKRCDLDRKIGSRAGSLSGGQMSGSHVCLIDECSSGVDALARGRLNAIILDERSRSNRTIIFTTHFLDEADALSDVISIMSKGSLKMNGTAPEIKAMLGFYRIHLFHIPAEQAPNFENVIRKDMYDQSIYIVPNSAQAADILIRLEEEGFKEYQISGPTIEDAFMKIAEEMADSEVSLQATTLVDNGIDKNKSLEKNSAVAGLEQINDQELQLLTGTRLHPIRQSFILFRKRATVFRRNALPNLATFLIPVIAAGLASIYLKGFTGAGCSPTDRISASDVSSLASQVNYSLVIGPSSRVSTNEIDRILSTLLSGESSAAAGDGTSSLPSSVRLVDSLSELNSYVNLHYGNVTPGAIYLGDQSSPPTIAYQGNGDISLAVITQNILDTLLTIPIATQYSSFDTPWQANQGDTLQFCVYLGLALAIYPAFFSLYPTVERLRNVRGLHYSNGVRALPLWLAYILYDFCFVLAGSVVSIIILRARSDAWYYPGYLFVVLFLYGITSTLYSYVVSLFAKSQLAAFAIAAGSQAVMFLLYIIAYLSVLTYAPVDKIDSYLLIVHFTIGFFFPTANLIRALFVSLNIFSIICRDRSVASEPNGITIYGGPLLYLIIQAMILFVMLVWWDSGSTLGSLFRRKVFKMDDAEGIDSKNEEISTEIARVDTSTDDGLRVLHISKSFGRNKAVQDISFGVKRGEVFALLGPNGAGKSTTISMIRGDIRPSNNGGDIFIENISVIKHRAAARQALGVCPQFDAIDQMTVLEHLRFYARIRGVSKIEHNVHEIIRAVGLGPFQTRMAASLSGGNKRKLSLGIALMGNPRVLLLDEPSSGMDVAAKRVMWKTLAS
ncbi:MAG: hypothetical protein Q9187_006284, partial [Circinaria calcarea]